MSHGPYWVDQVPAEPLVLSVTNFDGTPRDLTAYDTITLEMRDSAGNDVNTSAGTLDAPVPPLIGTVTYHFPGTTLFAIEGTYLLRLALDGPGSIHDLTRWDEFDVLDPDKQPLTPTPAYMAFYWGTDAPTDDADWPERAAHNLEEATDLLYLVTGLAELPVEAHQARLVRYAITEMAIMLYVASTGFTEQYSGFSSETIASYHYAKDVRNAAVAGGPTGVAMWDAVVAALNNGTWDDAYSLTVDGEVVFRRGYDIPYRDERLLHVPLIAVHGDSSLVLSHDPSLIGTLDWQPFGGPPVDES